MSTIFLAIGQCGNQLTDSFIRHAQASQTQQSSYLFNHYDNKFHFINMDSEIKVINSLTAKHGKDLRAENMLNTKCGRGNNWAAGYMGLESDGAKGFIEDGLEAVRRESERCDFLMGFDLMHSLSGGTGSGCSSRFIEHIRDEYGSKKYLFTQSVAPFSSGELPLQHYNNLLCMSHLHEFTDGICLFQNDDVFEILEKSSKDTQGPKPIVNRASKPSLDISGTISLSQMNDYIIKSLLGAILPVDNVSLQVQSIGMELNELQRLLCYQPSTKIIELYNVNGTEQVQTASSAKAYLNKSNPLLKGLLGHVPKHFRGLTRRFTGINSLVIARGQSSMNSVEAVWADNDSINKCLNPVEWNPFSIDFWSSKTSILTEPSASSNAGSKPRGITPTSLTMVLNRNKCVEYLTQVRDKSAEKYVKKAYLHWFSKFGVDEDMFENAFANCQNVIDSYRQMTDMDN